LEGRKGHVEDMPYAERAQIKRKSVDHPSVQDRETECAKTEAGERCSYVGAWLSLVERPVEVTNPRYQLIQSRCDAVIRHDWLSRLRRISHPSPHVLPHLNCA
jgi:hypothetical protein